jgi:hypothetical protein
LAALANFMRLSLTKAAHVVASCAAWQEIRVRSGRDDRFVWERGQLFPGKFVGPPANRFADWPLRAFTATNLSSYYLESD